MRQAIIERSAALQHEQWAGWTRWMIDKFSPEMVERWERQIKTPYAELSEREKDSDRVEARKVLEAAGFFELLEAAEGVINKAESNGYTWDVNMSFRELFGELKTLQAAIARARGEKGEQE